MGRLIEIGAGSNSRQLTLAVGDLLRLPVSGGRISERNRLVQIIGPLTSAAIGTNGRVIAPAATPNVMFLLAMASGSANYVTRDRAEFASALDDGAGSQYHSARATVRPILFGQNRRRLGISLG